MQSTSMSKDKHMHPLTHRTCIVRLTYTRTHVSHLHHPLPYQSTTHHPPSIAFKFGLIAMAAGIIGVPLGAYLVQRLRPLYTAKCDALVCAGGLLVSAPFVYASLVLASHSIHWCFVCMFVAELSLNMCWSIVADILLVRCCGGTTKRGRRRIRDETMCGCVAWPNFLPLSLSHSNSQTHTHSHTSRGYLRMDENDGHHWGSVYIIRRNSCT